MAPLLLLLALALSVSAGVAQDAQGPLVRLDSQTLGDPQFDLLVTELDRGAKTSTMEVIHRKGGPTGSTMIVVRGMYLVAKARHAAYFGILKEWDEPGAGRRYVVGFTNDENPDIQAAFGDAYSETDGEGAKRRFLSVARFAPLFEKTTPASPPPPVSPPDIRSDALLFQFRIVATAYKQEFGQNPPEGNAAFRRAMTGDNPRKIVFMEFRASDVSPEGELLDSWKTPYRVGTEDGAYAIRSAGPDGKFGTGDDLVFSLR